MRYRTITADNVHEIMPNDQRAEAERVLREDVSPAIEHRRTVTKEGATLFLTLFAGRGRGAACTNGDSVWYDADTMDELYALACRDFTPWTDDEEAR